MQIEIDFDVFKHLTALRKNEAETFSDVIRSGVPPMQTGTPAGPQESENGAWNYKGVKLPEGTELQTTRNGVIRKGSVKDRLLDFPGYGSFRTPSSAGEKVLGLTACNGWYDLLARRPGERHFRRLREFRKRD